MIRMCKGVSVARSATAAAIVGAMALATPARAQVTVPAGGQNLLVGETITITWSGPDGCNPVDVDLYQGTDYIDTVADDIPNSGSFSWDVEDYLLGPSCNLRLRVGCPGNYVWSDRFGIDGLLVSAAIEGDRSVTLRWPPVAGDTLGAAFRTVPAPGDRVFGGYSVWRRTYDNLFDPGARGRFEKVRNYDVTTLNPSSPNPNNTWTFERALGLFGPVEFEIDEETTEIDTLLLAQSLTIPADSTLDVCNVRLYTGEVFGRWTVTLDIVRMTPGGVPDVVSAPLASSTIQFGTGAATSLPNWRSFSFTPTLTLDPSTGTEYAIVVRGTPLNPSGTYAEFATWVGAVYDAFDGGEALYASEAGRVWQAESDTDFAFVIGITDPDDGVGCVSWRGQRREGQRLREFRDPDDILAFVPGEPVDDPDGEGQIIPFEQLIVPGPYNGFQLEYAVTAYDRERQASANIEYPSACEDTLLVDGYPDGVQPASASVWPEVLFTRSDATNARSLLSDVYPVPNPYVRDVNSPSFPRWELPGERRIHFVNLPRQATVKIYSLAGDFLRRLDHDSENGTLSWDLQNDQGEIVTSGVYLWLVETESGERKTGQLVIVR